MTKIYIFISLILMSSCTQTRITVGDGPVIRQGRTKVYSKAKQMRIVYGLFPLGCGQPTIPSDKNFQIKTTKNLGDVLISSITLGVVSSTTVKIIVKREPRVKDGDSVSVKEKLERIFNRNK